MNEISFRAWDKNKKEMLFYEGIFNTPDIRYDTRNLMQDTGLKDKKGVKIFGGDIIDYQDYLGIVKFGVNSKKTDVLGYKYAKIGFYIKNITNYGKEYKLESAWWQGRCKIIGNIYQNKDLLT